MCKKSTDLYIDIINNLCQKNILFKNMQFILLKKSRKTTPFINVLKF